MKIFLICPVERADGETQNRIAAYVEGLEKNGHAVHWPARDTNQDDPTGGYEICRTNFRGIVEADEIHIWYAETSGGSKFDMGGVFMLVEMFGAVKRIIIANDSDMQAAGDTGKKSFYKVFKHLIEKQIIDIK